MLSEKPWRADRVIQLGVALFVCLCFGMVTAGALHEFGVKGFNEGEFGLVLVGTLSFQGAACLLIFVFLHLHQVWWVDAFGLRDPRLGRVLLWALVVSIVIFPIIKLLQYQSLLILDALNRETTVQTAVKMLQEAGSIWMRVYLGLFAV